MRTIKTTEKFKKDLKKAAKDPTRKRDIPVLDNDIIPQLLAGNPLAPRYCDHELTGFNPPVRDCHVLADLVLLYRLTDSHLILVRLGTHSELFG